MPGTIRVSVLDLVDLSSSSISVKVSMGKREYQTWDKGEFSFPLTALRDNLIVTLYDAEGNELCRRGVETRLIVEKGVLDDLLPLEGGGQLHMKFQFILTEEDRKRIREMRESAFRKKHGELLTSSLRQSESASVAVVGGSIPSSLFSSNDEITDSHKRVDQMEAVSVQGGSPQDRSISNPVTHAEEPTSSPGKREGIHLGQLVQDDTDGNERTSSAAPLAQKLNVLHLTEANQRTATQTSPTHIPTMPISAKEALGPRIGSPESSVVDNYCSVSSTPDEFQTYRHEKHGALEKTPSNVRKMITAFESSLSQGPAPRDNVSTERFPLKNNNKEVPLKAPSVKEAMIEKTKAVQSNEDTGMKAPSIKEAQIEKIKAMHSNEDTGLKPCSKGNSWKIDLLKGEKDMRRRDHVGLDAQTVLGISDRTPVSQCIGKLETLGARHTAAEETNSNKKVNSRIKHKKEGTILEQLPGQSVAETDVDLKRMNDAHVGTDQSHKLSEGEQGFSSHILEECELKACIENSNKQSSGNENYPFESSGNWIFQDETVRMCITTASKQVMNLVKAWDNYRETNQTEIRLSKAEAADKQKMDGYTPVEVIKNGKGSHYLRKPKHESLTDDKVPEGLIGQAIRITIMVAFGTLVLVTRQRNNR